MNQVCDGKNDCPNNEVRNLEILKPLKTKKYPQNLKKMKIWKSLSFHSAASLLSDLVTSNL